MSGSGLVTITRADEAKEELLPFKKGGNFAENKDCVAWVQKHLMPVMQEARSSRRQLEGEWEEIRRLVLLQHDQNQKYIGRSKAYVPSYLRARETLVSQLSRGLFPGDEYLDVKERIDGAKLQDAPNVKNYIKYEFEKIARLRMVIKPYLSQFIDYGITVSKGYYHKPLRSMTARLKKGTGGAGPLLQRDMGRRDEGLRFQPRSVFSVYVWPTTVDNAEDAEVVFEDMSIPITQAMALVKAKRWVDYPLDGRVSEHRNNSDQQQMEIQGTTSNDVGDSKLGTTVDVSECWLSMDLPASAYEPGEDTSMPVPVRVVVMGDKVMEIVRNPFWHQRSPFLFHRMRTFPGSWYPKGTGHAVKFLQYLVNDFTNQLNDNGTYALNPIIKANLNLLAGPVPALRPGIVIGMRDMKAIEFDRPPVEQIQYGQMLVTMYTGLLQDMSGSPQILMGSKGAKTATTTQVLQANAMNPLQDMIEDIEASTMVELMAMSVGYGQQFRTEAILDQLAGGTISVSPNDIAGSFVYAYLASSQAASQQQRAQQALTLLQVLPNMVPLLQAVGKIADPEPLLRRIFSDGFGFRGFEDFIKPMPPQPMLPGAPGTPGAGDMADAISGNAGTSPNPGTEAVAGEEGGFADVRDGADAMSAAAGAAEAGEPPPTFDTEM